MAQPFSIDATKRTMTGKRVRRLRAEGLVPAVIYGTVVEDPIAITVDERELQRTYQAIGSFTLLDVNLDGEVYTVYLRNLQMNPIKRRPVHAEFFAPNLRVAMTANVPLHLVGEIENDALIVTQARDSVELRGLPTNLPGSLEVDISTLVTLDDAIHVSDLTIGDDVEVLTDADELIARLTEPQLVVDEDEEATEEGDEEAAEEAADDEGESSDDEE